MKTTMTASDHFGFSNLKMIENMRMKMMHVDLVIVYRDTVINWKLQFDKPISKELAMPVEATRRQKTSQERVTRGPEKKVDSRTRNTPDNTNLTERWNRVTVNGK